MVKFGGTHYLRIPPHLVKFLDIKQDSKISIQDEEGKHGKFISAWKKEE